MHIILASESPRRHQLLSEILADMGLDFAIEVRPANINENQLPSETPVALTYRLARAKAEAVFPCERSSQHAARSTIIAADTIVVLQNQILGKPRNKNDAKKMLGALSGKTHEVMTGIALVHFCAAHSAQRTAILWYLDCVISQVTFRQLTNKEITDYVATGEPMDKAGAYAIQGDAAKFVTKLEGSFSNVVGLPKEWVGSLLDQGASERSDDE